MKIQHKPVSERKRERIAIFMSMFVGDFFFSMNKTFFYYVKERLAIASGGGYLDMSAIFTMECSNKFLCHPRDSLSLWSCAWELWLKYAFVEIYGKIQMIWHSQFHSSGLLLRVCDGVEKLL